MIITQNSLKNKKNWNNTLNSFNRKQKRNIPIVSQIKITNFLLKNKPLKKFTTK